MSEQWPLPAPEPAEEHSHPFPIVPPDDPEAEHERWSLIHWWRHRHDPE